MLKPLWQQATSASCHFNVLSIFSVCLFHISWSLISPAHRHRLRGCSKALSRACHMEWTRKTPHKTFWSLAQRKTPSWPEGEEAEEVTPAQGQHSASRVVLWFSAGQGWGGSPISVGCPCPFLTSNQAEQLHCNTANYRPSRS